MLSSEILFCLCFLPFCLPLIVQPEWKIYYDPITNKTIDIIHSSNPRHIIYRQLAKKLRIGFGPIPCSCQHFTCGCCTGMDIQAFNFNRRACMNFTYDPMEFAMDMDMLMDNEPIFSQSVSAKNPPPFCVPAPLPPLVVPSVDFCLRFFNIHTPGYNLFMCVDFETRMERAPLLVLHFDCMEFGQDGISYHKPDEIDYINGGDIPDIGQGDADVEQLEVYDEVLEEANSTLPNKSFFQGKDDIRGEVIREPEVYDEVEEDQEDRNRMATTETPSTTESVQN